MSSRAESWSPRGDSAAHNLPLITLRALPVEEAVALLDGAGAPPPGLGWHPDYPTAETLELLTLLTQVLTGVGWSTSVPVASPTGQGPTWWLQQIVLDGEVVGDVAFHGPPAPGRPVEVEIGYDVVPDVRGRGVATAACAAVLELAWAAGADAVLAETAPDHVASQRVLSRNGFVDRGHHRYRVERPW